MLVGGRVCCVVCEGCEGCVGWVCFGWGCLEDVLVMMLDLENCLIIICFYIVGVIGGLFYIRSLIWVVLIGILV